MRLGGSLSEDRLRSEFFPNPVLGIRHVVFKRLVHTLRTVEVGEFKSSGIDSGYLIRNFILKACAFIYIATHGFPELTDIENTSNFTHVMRNLAGLTSPAPDSRESVWRFRLIAFIRDELTTKTQNTASLVHHAIDGILLDENLRITIQERTRQSKMARKVQSVIRHRRNVAGLEPNMGMQEMKSGRDSRRLYLRKHSCYI